MQLTGATVGNSSLSAAIHVLVAAYLGMVPYSMRMHVSYLVYTISYLRKSYLEREGLPNEWLAVVVSGHLCSCTTTWGTVQVATSNTNTFFTTQMYEYVPLICGGGGGGMTQQLAILFEGS